MGAATCNFRWWDNNGVDQAAIDAGRLTFSSQQSSFPSSNAANDFRSKVWSPAGNFEITTANQKIYVEAVSATITAGYYIPATLATEIQTQLNIADSGWTVTYSTTTYKFTISNAGSKTLTLSSTTDAIWDDIGYIGVTDRVGMSFEADEQRNHTDEWALLDYGTPFTLSCAGLISLIDEQFPLSTNATIKLQANNIDLWSSPPLDVSLTRNARGVFGFIDGDFSEAARTYRWVRIQIIDKTNPLGPEGLRFSRLYLGDHSTTSTNIASGFNKPVVDPSTVQRSENGVAYFDEKVKYQRIQGATYQVIQESDRVYLEQLYQDYGKTRSLFVSIDPQGKVSTGLPEFTQYGHFEADPTPQNLFRDNWSFQFSFREAV